VSTRFAIGPVRHSEPTRNEAASEADQIRPGKLSLALAGGYAIQAHGFGSRASGDVGLFVNWAETFARLLVTDPSVVLTHQPAKLIDLPAPSVRRSSYRSRAIDRVETILMLQRGRTLIHFSPGDQATSHSR
jgi:hypothetical protein